MENFEKEYDKLAPQKMRASRLMAESDDTAAPPSDAGAAAAEKNYSVSSEFQEYVRGHPPIQRVFSPENELAKIRRLPKNEQRAALITFKELLARQRTAWAACRVFIEKSIEANNGIPKKELLNLARRFGDQYGFTNEQRKTAERLIDGYYKYRYRALQMRRRFPDDKKLIKKILGMDPEEIGQVDITVGPMTIDLTVGGASMKKIYEKTGGAQVSGFQYGGFAWHTAGRNPIFYTVINQDQETRGAFDDLTGEETRRHEHEHQKNELFRSVFKQEAQREGTWGALQLDLKFLKYYDESDPDITKALFESYMRAEMTNALDSAKDEITATLTTMSVSALQYRLDDLFFGEHGPCDYLGPMREWGTKEKNGTYRDLVEKILVKEYRAIIEKAVASYGELIKTRAYTFQEATALLTDKPLPEWPKALQRFLEQKNVR
ncbi:MAG: hypothetical protein A3I44_00735 [Candidatus Sungbacteria bacterium RIFCSPLOWO2_02_FULL_51_17]|uniref:Uncharacterized protein n=1 Tax=Candidatus Sungbacteria bacterium RIFCSPHIGHO2_02_FULL_51_29 TaxID=1802273 RepID=A0A1G2KTF3_9BACT|nr:MAG: hypothetical protein A2676_01780 [Candidatus Sungbacteria bacterium RIFCSPHIGHO2_01_FULL_51_22]OHA02504.1 MAG: hypothetical protein A3C16_01265 [Candidatus Sungbacteria bacterium RIFCSPHIGHO2_02_FULL_51_29]OHA05722.1 MAG: hypothetical protein A3B29_03195 [Candidatus Sungbacteria bacterium RIFCSPLOWO2_01_FULL_51_34]OHA10649.1 MAG: hypothetical protein A3I44_00735 [Candidatus Sungbacteria bacterium RIFCSPLOWO2_02_FULL_51_17]